MLEQQCILQHKQAEVAALRSGERHAAMDPKRRADQVAELDSAIVRHRVAASAAYRLPRSFTARCCRSWRIEGFAASPSTCPGWDWPSDRTISTTPGPGSGDGRPPH